MTAAESARKHEYASPFRFRPIWEHGIGPITRKPDLTLDADHRRELANAIPEGRRFRVASIEEIDRKREGEG